VTAAPARAEARLVAGTWTMWVGLALAVALCTLWSRGATPGWAGFAADSGRAALVLAGCLVLLGHLAASRDQRYGTAEFTGTLPASPRRRAAARLALVPVAGAVGALALGAELLILPLSGVTGRFDPWLLAGPVLTPMIGAAVGLAAGLWWPSTAAGPLTLFGVAALIAMLPVLGSSPGALPWLLFPVAVNAAAAPATTAWHVLYLVALLVAVVGAALARHWRRWATAVVAVALIAAVVATHRQQLIMLHRR